MSIKLRLKILNFFQLFIWGAWLITMANYWFNDKSWDAAKFGEVFGTMGIAAIFMPTITGIIADRWVNAERLYSVLLLLYGGALLYLPQVDSPDAFFYVMLFAMIFYMPTLALNNSISYSILNKNNFDVVKDFPPIRVMGTIGFIAAMWITNLTGNKDTVGQFYIGGAFAILLGIYALFLPKCPPKNQIDRNQPMVNQLGLHAFKLFTDYKMAIFFIFCMFLGGALQLTNAYGDLFLSEFEKYPDYANLLVVERSTIIMSISQISETLFILAIPFFLKKYGIKNVMLISMLAWVFRFGLLAYGDPAGGLWMIVLSCIIYGMAFDFFNISGSLFVETNTNEDIRSSAQGLFMMMTNGFGAILGSYTAGWAIKNFFTLKFDDASALASHLKTTTDNPKFIEILSTKFNTTILENGTLSQTISLNDWHTIWMVFAAYALIIAFLFSFLFKYKHQKA